MRYCFASAKSVGGSSEWGLGHEVLLGLVLPPFYAGGRVGGILDVYICFIFPTSLPYDTFFSCYFVVRRANFWLLNDFLLNVLLVREVFWVVSGCKVWSGWWRLCSTACLERQKDHNFH